MQDDLQRMELEANSVERRSDNDQQQPTSRHAREPSLSTYTDPKASEAARSQFATVSDEDIRAYQNNDSRAERLDTMSWDAPSFSPFPKVKGDNIPPTDEEKEEILWNARKHVLHSQNVSMQITWARDVLTWAEIAQDAVARENPDKPRAATPRIEHELRVDALNIITYLSRQEHPEALYMRSKWLEFGKFGNRVDKREAYGGYKRAAELGHGRSEYRMGMLYEQSNDMSKAKEHYYRGLSLKDSASLYRMGMMSLLGQHGESKDYSTGLERIQLAADSSDEDAPQGAYVYGMLVGRDLPDIAVPDGLLPVNMQTAKMYIEKAAYLGFAKAQLKMGQAYELCQFGCEFNPSFSLHYYGLAAKQGLPEAALGVSRWFLFGYEGVFKKNEQLAYKYAQEAADAKLPTGEFALGYYHEIGIHVEKSLSEARKWYQIAADHGNKDAVGRLESLSHNETLSKSDHETTTLTRIKSQHGSQRGKRPDRFKQPQQMPTLKEGSSAPTTPITDGPQLKGTSPGSRPTIVSNNVANIPGPSRASFVIPAGSSDRPPAFNVRVDNGPNMQPQSAAPYPEDDRPNPLTIRSKSAAPYPDDDVRGPGGPHFNPSIRPSAGPHADRPVSAFGIKTAPAGPGGPGRPMPGSQSMGNLQPHGSRPDSRGRVASAGYGSQGPPGNFRQPSPGPGPASPPYAEDNYGRVSSPGRDYGPRSSSRPNSDMPPQGGGANYERFSRVPGASGRPERLSSLPPNQQQQPPPPGSMPPRVPTGGQGSPMVSGGAGPGRVGSAPPQQFQQRPGSSSSPLPSPGPSVASAATAPAKPPPAKGPATFEDMGIPQGKQEGDCVSHSLIKLRALTYVQC